MAKISIDVDEIKKNLKSQALTAKAQLTVFAKKAQKDLEAHQVYKKVETVLEKVKSQGFAQELMKNPKVQEITKSLIAASEQLEKAITKNATTLIEEVKSRVNKPAPKAKAKKTSSKTSSED
jgi:hypothetical protein